MKKRTNGVTVKFEGQLLEGVETMPLPSIFGVTFETFKTKKKSKGGI